MQSGAREEAEGRELQAAEALSALRAACDRELATQKRMLLDERRRGEKELQEQWEAEAARQQAALAGAHAQLSALQAQREEEEQREQRRLAGTVRHVAVQTGEDAVWKAEAERWGSREDELESQLLMLEVEVTGLRAEAAVMQEEVVVKEEALEALQQALMHAVGRENARAGGAAEALAKLLVSAKVEISELNRRLKKAHDGERDLRRDRQLLLTHQQQQQQQQQQQASRAVTQEEQARAGSSSRQATTKKAPPGAAGASSAAASTLPPPLAVTFSPRSGGGGGGGVGKDARYGHDAWRERSRESSPQKALGSGVRDLRVSGEYGESRLSCDSADWAAAGCLMLYITILCRRILVDTDEY